MNDKSQRKMPGGFTGKGFVKGDPRINRRGRPKYFDQFRKMAQQILHEKVLGPDGNMITRVEALLRSWLRSKNPLLQRALIEYAFGKVPDKVVHRSRGSIHLRA
jgi:hypothetical protein